MRGGLWLRAAAAACTMWLVSCGGGGGGDSGSAALEVRADRTSLAFVGFRAPNAGPTAQSVGFTLVNGSGTHYGQVLLDQATLFSADFIPTSGSTAIVTLTPFANAPIGTRSGTITFRLCTDNACAHVAWSQTLPYTMSVFDVDTTSVALTGSEGAVGAARPIAVSPPDTTPGSA